MLKSPLMLKGLALLGCMALLLIPLRILSVVIGERADYRDDVSHSLEHQRAAKAGRAAYRHSGDGNHHHHASG